MIRVIESLPVSSCEFHSQVVAGNTCFRSVSKNAPASSHPRPSLHNDDAKADGVHPLRPYLFPGTHPIVCWRRTERLPINSRYEFAVVNAELTSESKVPSIPVSDTALRGLAAKLHTADALRSCQPLTSNCLRWACPARGAHAIALERGQIADRLWIDGLAARLSRRRGIHTCNSSANSRPRPFRESRRPIFTPLAAPLCETPLPAANAAPPQSAASGTARTA
jgi:hypothetical protein